MNSANIILLARYTPGGSPLAYAPGGSPLGFALGVSTPASQDYSSSSMLYADSEEHCNQNQTISHAENNGVGTIYQYTWPAHLANLEVRQHNQYTENSRLK